MAGTTTPSKAVSPSSPQSSSSTAKKEGNRPLTPQPKSGSTPSPKKENPSPESITRETETNLFAIPWSPRTHAGIPPPTEANSPLAPQATTSTTVPSTSSSSSAANSTTSTSSTASKRKASTPSNAGDTPSRSNSADPTSASTTASASKKRRTSSTGPESEKPSKMSSERPRLSEQEKKNNHIASEQKRRLAIREGFDRLTEIVPGLEGQGRSESIVLKKSVDHMRDVLQERAELVQRIEALGGEVPPELKQV
ncbi:hypothetical protein EX30DRAFT_337037 [Ascodesmis nigricans]|uniref:BHLH domain-containing protein n=1 Tax=Ascodesmis nigricans TaxID=341454 RepID=A0A4S2N5J4_9PEZI|nr:hypothetical protein EX30DRAFT_337037 [Ascodesmis nigricans]